MALTRQDVERLLSPDFVEGVSEAPVAVLRTKRAECRQVEELVSYLRRVVQGQIDLAVAEMELRLAGGGGGEHQRELVEHLPSILAGSRTFGPDTSPSSAGAPRATSVLSPRATPGIFGDHTGLALDEIAAVVSPELAATKFKGGTLPGANLEVFADAELTELVEQLRRHEAVLSAERKVLHERIDLLQAIVVERYKSGAARPDSLLEDHELGDGATTSG